MKDNTTTQDKLKPFIDKFCQTTALAHKKDLVVDFLAQNTDLKPAVIIPRMSSLSDRKRLIEYIASCKAKLSFFENWSLSRWLADADKQIERKARSIFTKITVKNRQGKKFEEILFGVMSPLVKENESAILRLVLRKINKIKETSPIIRIYSSFMGDLTASIDIVQSIKDKGLSERTIEDALERAKSRLSKPGMRTILQNVFFMDPAFALHLEKIKALLQALRSKELEKESENRHNLAKETSLTQLSNEQDLDAFLDKASVLMASNSKYVTEMARLFDLQFNKPLLSIYKILKFPIDRESFWKWMQKAPVPTKILPEINAQIAKLKIKLNQETSTGKIPADYDEIVKLIYNHTLCFTNKYRLITETIKTHPEKQALLFCLEQIKNVHYKIENQFLVAVINQINNCFSFSEVEKVLLEDRKKIGQRIEDYKLKLKKNIDKLLQSKTSENYRILPSVLKSVIEEKIISEDGFLQVDRKVNPEHKLGFIVRLANSLIGYYFLLNLRLILVLWLKYFGSLKASDGVFIRHKLSSLTKEEIYELCSHYVHEKGVVIENLTKYLAWGKAEGEVRRQMLERLGTALTHAPEIIAGKYRLRGYKYGSIMRLSIIDEDKRVRFSNKTKGVNSFLDFLNVIKQSKLENLLNVSDDQLKILFQNIHLDKIAELSSYIEERLGLLTFKNSLTCLSAKEMEIELKKHKGESGYLNELSAGGEKERVMRSELLGKLEQELKETPLEDTEIIKRIRSEIENQHAALGHIDLMMDIIRKPGIKQEQPELTATPSFNTRKPVNEERVVKAINSNLPEEESVAVEREIKANDLTQQEADEYFNKDLASPTDVSAFGETRRLEKQAAAPSKPGKAEAVPTGGIIALEDGKSAEQEEEITDQGNGELTSKVEDEAKEDIKLLLTELEGLTEFTDLSAFARKRDFKEAEEKRLAGIMDKLISKGNFIYLAKDGKLLGAGKLKFLIEEAFNEFSSGKKVSTDPYMLKKAWDFVRSKSGIQEQLRLLGASSMEERSYLFKELEKMLQPHGAPALKLTKKRLYQQKEVGQEDKKTPPLEQKEDHKPAVKKDIRVKTGGLFTARPKLKKKPKAMPRQKQASFSATTRKYIMHSFAPVIMEYMKSMYRNKRDFYIPISGKKQYYTLDILRRSVEGILRKDAKGQHHADLLQSLKQDERLFSLIVSELFIEYKTGKGDKIYFPRFIKGEIGPG